MRQTRALALAGELHCACDFVPRALELNTRIHVDDARIGYANLSAHDELDVHRAWCDEAPVLAPFRVGAALFLQPSPMLPNERRLRLEVHASALDARVAYGDYQVRRRKMEKD